MTPLRTTLALLLVLAAVLLAAGCENQDRYQENHDIVLIKLDRDGSPVWTRVLDTGTDNTANDIMEISDGSFLIGGLIRHEPCKPHYDRCEEHPRVIRLSGSGTILWDLSLNESTNNEVMRIVRNQNGNFTAVTHNGTFWEIDSAGRTLAIQPSGVSVFESPEIIRTSDNGYAILCPFGPPALVKINPDGNISWKKTYDDQSISQVLSIAEMQNGEGYLIAGYDSLSLRGGGQVILIRTNPDGTIIRKTPLEKRIESYNPIIEPVSTGYIIRYRIDLFTRGNYVYTRQNIVYLDKNGIVLNQSIIDTTKTTVVTREGDYCFVGFYSVTALTNLYADHVADFGGNHEMNAVRLGTDGIRIWDIRIPDITISSPIRIIQTSDGGFAILALRDVSEIR